MKKVDFRYCPFCGGNAKVDAKYIPNNKRCLIKFLCDKCEAEMSIWGKDEKDCMEKWRWRSYPDCYKIELDTSSDKNDTGGKTAQLLIIIRYKSGNLMRVFVDKNQADILNKNIRNAFLLHNPSKGNMSIERVTPNFVTVEDIEKNKLILNLNEIECISVPYKEDDPCTTK